MAQKRYQLTATAQAETSMLSAGSYKFRARWVHSDGSKHPSKECPIFELPTLTWTIGTANEGAQRYLEHAKIPMPHANRGADIWVDVTGSTTTDDVDLTWTRASLERLLLHVDTNP